MTKFDSINCPVCNNKTLPFGKERMRRVTRHAMIMHGLTVTAYQKCRICSAQLITYKTGETVLWLYETKQHPFVIVIMSGQLGYGVMMHGEWKVKRCPGLLNPKTAREKISKMLVMR